MIRVATGRIRKSADPPVRVAANRVGRATMSGRRIKRALISVYDKTGVVEFARTLRDEFGIEILSTGGTASLLRDSGIPVIAVEEITGVGEMLDGRVKTLHPTIHAAILADRDNPDHTRQLCDAGIEPIDMVVVNLYPFEQTITEPDCTVEQATEMIDIGGPCLLRAAAKNHKHVFVVSRPDRYAWACRALREWDRDETRAAALQRGGEDAFVQTASYDGTIAGWLSRDKEPDATDVKHILLCARKELRYGENPHQVSAIFTCPDDHRQGVLSSSGVDDNAAKQMSFNNFLDSNAALLLCEELASGRLPQIACFVKHSNACGVGIGSSPIEAYRSAYLGNPNAAMGGILAVNFEVDASVAEAVMDSLRRWGKSARAGAFFVEVWLAPSFEKDAIDVIRTKKRWGANVRLLNAVRPALSPDSGQWDLRRITGGILLQSSDTIGLNEDEWQVATERSPTGREWADLRLAWLIAKHTTSNAVSICKNGMLIGNGAGQMSRVMSCRIATWLANDNGHAEALSGAVAASDGFFPFRDGPDILMDAGISAIIQPGGAKRDAETVAACNERGAAMVFTRTRHFRH
ncbi:MAG: bifunctional phosphoribosylaminoimidazolecarboxamide formyltransferase/IMP cyclohydrolase [Phycisphaerales bacterium]|nr:MAG: bifunctional phosphoribosylaminoimidazolecarboxamide formyltransferase/IMP cyclohydrolase [Phycisphaerales bacterium]